MKNTPLMEKEITSHVLFSLFKKGVISRRIYLKYFFFARDLSSWLRFVLIHVFLLLAITGIVVIFKRNYLNWDKFTEIYKISLFSAVIFAAFAISLLKDFEKLSSEIFVCIGLTFTFLGYFVFMGDDLPAIVMCVAISFLMVLLTKSVKVFALWFILSLLFGLKYFI